MATRLPMGLALSTVAVVWVLGCVWSFTEQTAFARAKGFADPTLLPLVIDGLAVSMAAVAFAASLDGRPALAARLGTALAVFASAASNGLWAAERSGTGGAGPDLATVVIGAGIPIAANIAFEVLLAELRRQVQRRRGLPAPAPLPTLRMARLLLAPTSTFRAWRLEVLDATSSATRTTGRDVSGSDPGPGPRGPNGLNGPSASEIEHDGNVVPACEGAEPLPCGGRVTTPEHPVSAPASQQGAAVTAPAGGTSLAVAELASRSGTCVSPRMENAARVLVDSETTTPSEPPAARRPSEPETGIDPTSDTEANPKVWRLADYLRESGLDPETISGDDVVMLGLCQSARNGRRLAARAAALCAALAGSDPPPRPDLSGIPRLLLAGEAPTLALVAREESR